MPTSYPIDLYRGDSWARDVRFWTDDAATLPADLTGVVAAAQIRDAVDGDYVIELDAIVELPNIVHLQLPAANWSTEPGPTSGVWDLQLHNATTGNVWTPLAGPVRITGDVTPAPA